MPGTNVSFKGRVVKIEESRVPQVYIVTIEGEGRRLKADIHKELMLFKEGDKVEVVVSKSLPEYREGEDYCGKGHMFSKRAESREKIKLLVSLGGFLNVIEVPRKEDVFEVMDEVYLCIKRV